MLGIASPLPTPAVLREAGQAARPHVPCSPQGEGQPKTQGEQDGDPTPEALWGPWGEEDGKEDMTGRVTCQGPPQNCGQGCCEGGKKGKGIEWCLAGDTRSR